MIDGQKGDVVARETQVRTEISVLAARIETLAGRIGAVGARLKPVIRETPKEGKENGVAPLDKLVPLAEEIRSIRWQVEAMDKDVSYVLDNWEL